MYISGDIGSFHMTIGVDRALDIHEVTPNFLLHTMQCEVSRCRHCSLAKVMGELLGVINMLKQYFHDDLSLLIF